VLVPGLFAALFFGAECAVYRAVCGDWLHSLHANLGGRGAKDTESMSLLHLPVRYLSTLWKGNRLAPFFCIFGATGLWALWRKGGREGRAVVLWFGVLFAIYSCAVQSLHPLRPMIGSTARYLATMVVPISVLVVAGAREFGRWLLGGERRKMRALGLWLGARPVLAGGVAFAGLALFSERGFYDPGYVVPLRRYMASVPDGTRVFSHHAMYLVACLVGPARRRALQMGCA